MRQKDIKCKIIFWGSWNEKSIIFSLIDPLPRKRYMKE